MQMMFTKAEESDIIGKEDDYLLVNSKTFRLRGLKIENY
jgi:hypothetical protein